MVPYNFSPAYILHPQASNKESAMVVRMWHGRVPMAHYDVVGRS